MVSLDIMGNAVKFTSVGANVLKCQGLWGYMLARHCLEQNLDHTLLEIYSGVILHIRGLIISEDNTTLTKPLG